MSVKSLFTATTSHSVVPRRGMVTGVQLWLSVTSPCRGTKATGRCSGSPRFGVMCTAPKCWVPGGSVSSIVIVIVADSPGSSSNLRGSTVIVPASLSALVVNRCRRPLTFVATRVVVRRPGITGAFTDGRLRCTALTGRCRGRRSSSAVSSNVRAA